MIREGIAGYACDAQHVLRNHTLAAEFLRQSLQAGGDVWGVTEAGEGDMIAEADLAQQRYSTLHSYAEHQLHMQAFVQKSAKLADVAGYGLEGGDCLRAGRACVGAQAEDRQDAIAEKLIRMAARTPVPRPRLQL